MERTKELSGILSDITNEFCKKSQSINFSDFSLVYTAKEKLVMACASLIFRANAEMSDAERALVQKLIESSTNYIHFMAGKERS